MPWSPARSCTTPTRTHPSPDRRVGLLSGGGSGHEPLHIGFVGAGQFAGHVLEGSPSGEMTYLKGKFRRLRGHEVPPSTVAGLEGGYIAEQLAPRRPRDSSVGAAPSPRGGCPSSAVAMAAMCSGVLPQQPPELREVPVVRRGPRASTRRRSGVQRRARSVSSRNKSQVAPVGKTAVNVER